METIFDGIRGVAILELGVLFVALRSTLWRGEHDFIRVWFIAPLELLPVEGRWLA